MKGSTMRHCAMVALGIASAGLVAPPSFAQSITTPSAPPEQISKKPVTPQGNGNDTPCVVDPHKDACASDQPTGNGNAAPPSPGGPPPAQINSAGRPG